jgi:hypothetical protein
MASPQADAFHDMVRQYRVAALGSGAVPTIDEMRAGSEATMAMIGVAPEGVATTEITLAGRRALQFDGLRDEQRGFARKIDCRTCRSQPMPCYFV